MEGVTDDNVRRAHGETVQEPLPACSTPSDTRQRRESTPPSASEQGGHADVSSAIIADYVAVFRRQHEP